MGGARQSRVVISFDSGLTIVSATTGLFLRAHFCVYNCHRFCIYKCK